MTPTSTSGSERSRIASLDILRGAVMVLMALDHVRVFSGVPAGGRTPAVFFTRWVTHFCAPAFLFLAGTAIFLYGRKLGGRAGREKLARFLLVRGAWLILLEMTVIRFSWTFNFDYAHYALAGVIWVIGCCMIMMAGLVFLPVGAVGALGAVIVAAHNLMDGRFWQIADKACDDALFREAIVLLRQRDCTSAVSEADRRLAATRTGSDPTAIMRMQQMRDIVATCKAR